MTGLKKIVFIVAIFGVARPAVAQEKYLTSAIVEMKKGNLDEAKEDIDKAMASQEMQEKPKALLAKAQIYLSMQQTEKYKKSTMYQDASAALIKITEVKPDYETDQVNQFLLIAGALYFNDGVTKYSNKSDSGRYMAAAESFKNVLKIRELGGGKRFANFEMIKAVDSAVISKAKMFLAYCYYFTGKYAEATPLLIEAKDNPVTKSTFEYEYLIDIYEKQKNMDLELATIQEGRAAFPNDIGLRNDELNYYMITGKQDELVKKLEIESAKDPNNAEMLFNIGIVCNGMANPKTGKKPDNRAELMAKAEDAYLKAVKIAPENPDYNYNLGGFYNNRAKEINDQMNALGTSAAEQKKYDDLKVKRDELFDKALPYMDKAYNFYDAKAATLKPAEKSAYSGSIQVLMQIYSIQNKMDKVDVLKKKINAIK